MQVKVSLSEGYYLGIAFFCMFWGLGLLIHFFHNNRVFPKIIDENGIMTRSGKFHKWDDLIDWERNKLVISGSDIRITGNITFYFKSGKVLIGSFPIKNMDEVLNFLAAKFGSHMTPG